MTLIIYNLFIWIYTKGIQLASLWNPKAKQWLEGRRNILQNLTNSVAELNKEQHAGFIWMHCASLGEFEQGRPVLESLRNNYPRHKILLTFFSPSGFEVRKNYPGADLIFYLPIDSKKNATAFLKITQPCLAIFVKYEFWFHYLHELKKQDIPTILISAIFHPHQTFFKWYGRLHRYMLSCFTQTFVQNISSKELLLNIGHGMNVQVSGDTRFDRVSDIHKQFIAMPAIAKFVDQKKTLVAGSTWREDEKLFQDLMLSFPELKLIIAPHEIHASHIHELTNRFPSAILFSQLINEKSPATAHCLIIDNIGMLSSLYHYAHISYIGGGFNESGIHNILEAAVYNKPVIFGPNYSKFNEATDLLKSGGAHSVKDKKELEKVLENLLSNCSTTEKIVSALGWYNAETKTISSKFLL